MNFDPTPIIGTPRISGPTRSTPPPTRRVAPTKPAAAKAVALDTIPASPPPEVLAAIGTASQAYDRLAASGRQLHFGIDQSSGKVVVELQDLSGNVLSTLSPSQALDIAGGEPLD